MRKLTTEEKLEKAIEFIRAVECCDLEDLYDMKDRAWHVLADFAE